ncbi:TetR/AcrR family transcriptional regulator [Halalkalibacter nanhaiisediminis]|nr:TetR/AcrR family transcriptional regulator [Halalkalibacter nanhaiisediminis]
MKKCEIILKAANEVFLESGYEKSTVKDIAMQAGVGKGTIYEYFSSKEELFTQMMQSVASYVFNDIKEIIFHADSIEELLEGFSKKCILLIDEHADKLQVLTQDLEHISKDLQKWLMNEEIKLHVALTSKLKQFISSKQMKNVQPESAAWTILNMVRLAVHLKLIINEKRTEDFLREQIHILLYGMK